MINFASAITFFAFFQEIPRKSIRKHIEEKNTIWNTNKPGGWEEYFKKTENNAELDEIASVPNSNMNLMMKRIDKVMTKIKYSTFGKVTESKKK